METKALLKKDLEKHIEDLEMRLKRIYTLTPPNPYFEESNAEEVYILEQLERFDLLESIYSIIDNDEVRISKTAKEYLESLQIIRKSRSVLDEEKKKIELENSAEIENISLLINEFKLNAANITN